MPETPARSHRFRLYIDESGDHTYSKLDDKGHRYLGLLGVWFRSDYDAVFREGLERLKSSIFPKHAVAPVVLHRTDIIAKRHAFGILADPDKQKAFDDGILALITEHRFRVMAVVIDKKLHRFRYSNPAHPYHYCVEALLERYTRWLNDHECVGDVMAESRGRNEDNNLREAYASFYTHGCTYAPPPLIQSVLTSKEIKIRRKSENIAGLQLADVLAQPLKASILVEKGHFPRGTGTSFREKVWDAVQPRLHRNAATNKIDGYGIKLL